MSEYEKFKLSIAEEKKKNKHNFGFFKKEYSKNRVLRGKDRIEDNIKRLKRLTGLATNLKNL